MRTQKLSLLKKVLIATLLMAPAFVRTASAQLYNLTPNDLKAYTATNPYGRYPDGRPMIPDKVLDSVKALQIKVIEANEILRSASAGYLNQFEAGWKMLQPGKNFYGRAVTVQFMPQRPELVAGMRAMAAKNNTKIISKAGTIDSLEKNDVAVIDLYGRVEGGLPYVGDKLAYYMSKTTGTGFIVDGGIYYIGTMAEHGVQGYYRGSQNQATGQAAVTGFNVPIHIGNVLVMPGDLIIADEEGILAVPPQFVHQIIANTTANRRRDEWIRAAFDLNKWKSSEIYGSPKDPVLLKMFNDYKATGDKKYLPANFK